MTSAGTSTPPGSQGLGALGWVTAVLPSAALLLAGSPVGAEIPPGMTSLADADVRLVGEAAGQAGFHVDQAGDLDGDGFQDVIVGAEPLELSFPVPESAIDHIELR